jgi:hypothetical protein
MNKMGLKVFGNTGEAKLKVCIDNLCLEKFEDTKGVIRSRISKDRQYKGQKKKVQKTVNITLQIKLKNEQHQPKRQTMIYKTIYSIN